jgi:two-component system, NarL family, response regulator NreC
MPLDTLSQSKAPDADGARGRRSLTAEALMKVRVFVVDDHGILRGGLRALINLQPDMEVVGDAANGPDAESGIMMTEPDVVLMDISMPDGGGLAAVAAVKRIRPKTRIIVLTFHDELGYIRAARQAGAVGYIVKSAVDTELLAAIRAVARGMTFVDASLDLHLTQHQLRTNAAGAGGGNGAAPLTSRELEVMRRVAEGFTNAQVAEELGLGVKSVETYRSRIMAKLGLSGRVALVRFALECGILAPGRSVP